MYDIKQFRPTFYLLLVLGFVGYAVASQEVGVCFLAIVGTLLHAWLSASGRFRPLPRLAANVITLMFAGWLVMRVRQSPNYPIFAIGEFLVLLQLVKLYEQRANRDLAQLLVLSLLLMIAAAVSTGSLLFGLLFVAYLFLSLYCCLLFHLKTETDHARVAMGIDESKLNPATLRQDQRFLGRSMRRLTGLVGFTAVGMSVVVFLFFPRGSGAGVIGNLTFKQSQAMTGFSDQVSFQDVARISQNETSVATVKITKNGDPYGVSGQVIYLRGTVPNRYVSDVNEADRWKWIRSSPGAEYVPQSARGQTYDLNVNPAGTDRYVQEFELSPTGTNVLFAIPGIVSIEPGREIRMRFSEKDEVLQAQDAMMGDFPYTVVSCGVIGADTIERTDEPDEKRFAIPPEIREFALRPEVSGATGQAQQRLARDSVSELDEQIAHSIEQHLQTNFSYTLDLTDARRVADKDPLVEFLYTLKRGHCEYFAGAMALLCQSLGMDARMVVGFKCDEFNSIGGYYQVRQSQAHAWVEVRTLNGWQLFDPTSSREAAGGRQTSLWKHMTNFISYLDYTWGNNIVNFDAESQTNIGQKVEDGMAATATQANSLLNSLQSDWFSLSNFWSFSSNIIAGSVAIATVAIALALIYFLVERIRLRRRARRIGLDQLSGADQKR
ncbi:MAG: DUF3488 domain-containing protein, partial [Burkholderiales bacterium]|nr:DUF3488 domain-containing protein [Phycisphaerae bacterium]